MPAVNTDLMRQQMLTKTAGKVGQVIYWGRPLDWREGHRFRLHHPLRRKLLRESQSRCAGRPVDRPGDDRSAEIARHRGRQAVQSVGTDQSLMTSAVEEAGSW